jgi:ribosomal protein L36
MKMVGNQSPGVAGCACVGKDITNSFDKLIAIAVITEYLTTVDTSDNYMVKRIRRVYACFARHADCHIIRRFRRQLIYIFMGVPFFLGSVYFVSGS